MRFIHYIILFLLVPYFALAQDSDIDTGFKQVRDKAEKKDYAGALKILEQLEAKYPSNEDILVYEGRVYAWKKDYARSKKVLRPLAEREKPNAEALEAIINTYFWSYDFEGCIPYCDQYLALQPNNQNVLLIKAVCLEKAGRDAEALEILNKLPANPETDERVSGLKTIISRKKKNAISASYLNISTYDPGIAPVHYGYVEYLRKFTKSTIVGRANIGHRNGETEGQAEVDYYQNFTKSYLYTNVGVSNGESIFPKLRLGAEYYFAPQGHFDFSLGARYLGFDDNDITLITGQAVYRFHEYAVGYRPYYDIDNSLMSHVVSLQKTNEAKERLIRIELQYGNVPYLYLYNNFSQPLKAYRIGIQYQHKLAESLFIRPVFLYEYEEYYPSIYRNKYNCQVIVTKRF